MSGEAPFQDFPSYTERQSRSSKVVVLFLVLFFVVVAIFVGLYFLGKNAEEKRESVASVPTQMVSPTTIVSPEEKKASPSASPTPEKTLERSELRVVVLNGSGIAGAAGKVSTVLKNAGYSVERVGNATQFTYQGITILITEKKRGYLSQLKEDIAAEEPSVTIETEISDDISADAEVIIGK